MQPHWVEQHTAVQSLATYLRSAVHTDGLGCVVPPALLAHSNGATPTQPCAHLDLALDTG